MKLRWLLVLLLVVFVVTVPTLAQEGGPPVEGADPVLGVGDLVLNVYTLMGIVLTAIISGGALGIAGVGYVARKILTDPKGIAAIEKLGDSIPSTTAVHILELSRAAIDTMRLLEEALDRVPASEKPEVTPQTIPRG